MGNTDLKSLSMTKLFGHYRLAWRNLVQAEVDFSWRGVHTPEMADACITDLKNAKAAVADIEVELLRRLGENSNDC